MSQSPSTPPRLARRTFLIGAASAGVLAACGSGSDGSGTGSGTGGGSDAGAGSDAGGFAGDSADLEPDTFAVIQRYPADVAVPGEVRLPFSLAGDDAQFVVDGPATLGAQVVDLDGRAVGERIEAVRRDVSPAPYYAFRASIADPGIYAIVVDGGSADGENFQVFDAERVAVPHPGVALPAFETPTPDDERGVDPICTREPACPFHEVTLAAALDAGGRVAYLVGTPAFCQTGSCAPALEALIEVAGEFADEFTFVHAEVFTDTTASTVTPAVEAVSMTYEPAIFLTDADGVVVERLDGLWDVTELRERLALAAGG